MDFTWSDLIRHLTDWKRKDWRSDPERDAYRLENIEWVLESMLAKLSDAERSAAAVTSPERGDANG